MHLRRQACWHAHRGDGAFIEALRIEHHEVVAHFQKAIHHADEVALAFGRCGVAWHEAGLLNA